MMKETTVSGAMEMVTATDIPKINKPETIRTDNDYICFPEHEELNQESWCK